MSVHVYINLPQCLTACDISQRRIGSIAIDNALLAGISNLYKLEGAFVMLHLLQSGFASPHEC
jgi:formamidopyrimidine-DNA glycosylase